MARARNIKPGIYKNEDLAECSLMARYIFPGLWMLADREGRLEDRPKRIKAELLPFDNADADKLLEELAGRGFIIRYQNEDGSFIQVSKFLEHQSPHYSEKPSVIKPPPNLEDSRKKAPTSPEDSGKPPAIKTGSQPPDSLNPDSLNPESRNKDKNPPPDGGPIWSECLTILKSQNIVDGQARSFLGLLCREYEEKEVVNAIKASVGKANIPAYVRGVLKTRPKKGQTDKRLSI